MTVVRNVPRTMAEVVRQWEGAAGLVDSLVLTQAESAADYWLCAPDGSRKGDAYQVRCVW